MNQGKGRQHVEGDQRGQAKPENKGWLKRIVKVMSVPFLLFFSLVVGLMIGYGVMGKQPLTEVFDVNTYKHMYDLIFSGT